MEFLLGPLAGPESRRALSRTWVLVLRALAVVPPGMVLVVVYWIWWFSAQFDPLYRPGTTLTGGLVVIEGMLVTAALVLSPALLAGSLAGEKAAGFLTLVLGSRVSALEIIRGRLAGRLSIIAVGLLATLPVLVLLAAPCSLRPSTMLLLIALPASVALGGGGLALAASAVSRRGRDALLMVYLVDLVFLLLPVFNRNWLPMGVFDWVGFLSPYAGISALIELEDPRVSLVTIGIWTGMAIVGCLWAAWRLRPAYLRDAESTPRRQSVRRWGRVPPVSERPLFWKELYIEQRKGGNRFIRWLGVLLVVLLVGSALLSVLAAASSLWMPGDSFWSQLDVSAWITTTAVPMAWLLQWSVGLRAAVTVAAERERSTWDALLVTPLEGSEIVRAKTLGSLYALRWLAGAMLISWTLCTLTGTMNGWDYLQHVLKCTVVGVYMVVVGVWSSLTSQTATRAMTFTILGWLAGAFVVPIAAGLAALVVSLVGAMIWLAIQSLSSGTMWTQSAAPPPFGAWFSVSYLVASLLFYLFAALLIAAYCRKQFDRLAGRLG